MGDYFDKRAISAAKPPKPAAPEPAAITKGGPRSVYDNRLGFDDGSRAAAYNNRDRRLSVDEMRDTLLGEITTLLAKGYEKIELDASGEVVVNRLFMALNPSRVVDGGDDPLVTRHEIRQGLNNGFSQDMLQKMQEAEIGGVAGTPDAWEKIGRINDQLQKAIEHSQLRAR